MADPLIQYRSITCKLRVDGLVKSQWVCLGVCNTPEISRSEYSSPLLCTFGSARTTFAPVITGSAISVSSGDTVTITVAVNKRQLIVRHNESPEIAIKLKMPLGPYRMFACLFRPENRITILQSYFEPELDGTLT